MSVCGVFSSCCFCNQNNVFVLPVCSVVCYTESPLYLGTLIVFIKNFVKRKVKMLLTDCEQKKLIE